ncbi:hypothetical protein ANN_18403 [Periplaneta americana]|uniref:Uncharacterized protein n=1 Tax=Periplaneta americana TaxID=6978 RepID=A0ABQ8SPN3_PERAM|nr:hypothetical protein ANN_18403 [Periplaneta americana]
MAGLCEGGNEPAGSLKAISRMPEFRASDAEAKGVKKRGLVPLVVAGGVGLGRTTPSPRSPRRLRFTPESPISFGLGLTFPVMPLTRNDRSENDLDSFAEGVTSVEHGWIDGRELSHRIERTDNDRLYPNSIYSAFAYIMLVDRTACDLHEGPAARDKPPPARSTVQCSASL